MSPQEVGALPLKSFWMMAENIDRIAAQSDMRRLTVASAAHLGGEASQSVRNRLEIEKGDIVVLDEEEMRQATRLEEKLDAKGLNELRTLE
jgi:hypothetical protein